MTKRDRFHLVLAALIACILVIGLLENPQTYERRDGTPGRTYVDWRTGVLHEVP